MWTYRFLCNINNSRGRRSQEDEYQAIDDGLDCLVWDATKNAWWQWCLRATDRFEDETLAPN